MIVRNLALIRKANPTVFCFRTHNDRPVQARFRFGRLRVRIGQSGDVEATAAKGKELYNERLKAFWVNECSWNDIVKVLEQLPTWKPGSLDDFICEFQDYTDSEEAFKRGG